MHAMILIESNYKPVEKAEQQHPSAAPLEAPLKLPTAVLWEQHSNAQAWQTHSLTLAQAQELETRTRGQSAVQLWRTERANRITASHFGDITRRKSDLNEAFISSVYSKAGFRPTKYMKMGTENEPAAISRHQEEQGVQGFPVGLCINPRIEILGASPDGLAYDKAVQEYGLAEIKTLAKAKEKT